MFKLYPDTEKELFFDTDYKPVPDLSKLTCTALIELIENLYAAIDNAIVYHADLLSIALSDDIIAAQKQRMINYLHTVSSGTIGRIIDKTKYTEIDKAIEKTVSFLACAAADDYLLEMGTDPTMIETFIIRCYTDELKPE